MNLFRPSQVAQHPYAAFLRPAEKIETKRGPKRCRIETLATSTWANNIRLATIPDPVSHARLDPTLLAQAILTTALDCIIVSDNTGRIVWFP